MNSHLHKQNLRLSPHNPIIKSAVISEKYSSKESAPISNSSQAQHPKTLHYRRQQLIIEPQLQTQSQYSEYHRLQALPLNKTPRKNNTTPTYNTIKDAQIQKRFKTAINQPNTPIGKQTIFTSKLSIKENTNSTFESLQTVLQKKQQQKFNLRQNQISTLGEKKVDNYSQLKQKIDSLGNKLLELKNQYETNKHKKMLHKNNSSHVKSNSNFQNNYHQKPHINVFQQITNIGEQNSKNLMLNGLHQQVLGTPKKNEVKTKYILSQNKLTVSPTQRKFRVVTNYMANTQQQIQSCKAYAQYILEKANGDVKKEDLPILQNIIQNKIDRKETLQSYRNGSQKQWLTPNNKSVKIIPKSESNISFPNPHANKYYVGQILQAFQQSIISSFQQICRKHVIQSMDILSSPYYQMLKVSDKKVSRRFSPTNKITIVFDLDQTLVHCVNDISQPHHYQIPLLLPNNKVAKARFNLRNYTKECLYQLSKSFQLMVFTASHQSYANPIIDQIIDPKKELFIERYFRQDCIVTKDGLYLKDLRVIDRDLKKILLVDNSVLSYCLQLENGVPIIPYFNEREDKQLISLTNYLKQFINCSDVRIKNSEHFKLKKYGLGYKDVKHMIQQVYKSEFF